MRLGVVVLPQAVGAADAHGTIDRLVGLAEKVEAAGFSGIWLTDTMGRGAPTLDPLTVLAALAAVTKRIELGTCILQVPLREPVELAHRLESLSVLAGGRLRVGIGAGSTRADFDVVGADYEARFRTLTASLERMRRAWRGEAVHAAPFNPWPGAEAKPQVLLGAWRNPRWLARAAREFDGWIGSGLYGQWEDLGPTMKAYRDAGGKRAVLANVFADFRADPPMTPLKERATIKLVGGEAVARERFARLRDAGFDDVLLIVPMDDLGQLPAIAALAA